MKSFLLELAWEPSPPTEEAPVLALQGPTASLRLWGPGDAGLRRAHNADWFVLFSGQAAVRTPPGPLAQPETWLLERLSAGRALDGLLGELEGAFVLAAWRTASDELLLASDRAGSRCLYTAREAGRVLCSSHPQRIARALGRLEMDPQALSLYLGLKGIPAPWSPLKGVDKIRPGWRSASGRSGVAEREYWQPLAAQPEAAPGSLAEAGQGLLQRLEEAVLAYSAGRKTGIFLSGGLDSSVLAALAVRAGLELTAFTAGYAQAARSDETVPAALAAARLGIRQQVCRLDAARLPELTAELAPGFPEPLADASFWPQVELARLARGQVEVMLDGTGADSLLGGSNKFAVQRYARLYLRLPAALRRGLVAPLANLLPSSRRTRLANWIRLGQIFVQGCEAPAEEQGIYYSRFLQPETARGLLGGGEAEWPDLSGSLLREFLDQAPRERPVAAAGYMTFKTVQPWVELLKLANIESAGGFAVQKPFLYSRVAEFNLALPDDCKVRDGQGKLALRQAAAGLAPEEILRRRKANFSPPVGDWLSGAMREPFFAAFQAASAFNLKKLEDLFLQQEAGLRDWQSELWAVYMWQAWWNGLGQREDERA